MVHTRPRGHAHTRSADRIMALNSYEQHPKDVHNTPFARHVEDQHIECGLDPGWDEAYAATGLSPVAQTYLMNRHGTLNLDPMPSISDADPYNWRQSKKIVMLLLVAFHACMASMTATAVVPAYSKIAEGLGITVRDATYLTAVQMAILGVSPLAWRPLANTYGRRPIFLFSLIISAAANVACAVSGSYALMMIWRAVVAFFISPASAIGSAVVVETFLKKDRTRYIGVWMVMVTLGFPMGPLIFGFVTFWLNFRSIFLILAIVNGVQFILYFFFGPETLYVRSEEVQDDSLLYVRGVTGEKDAGFVAKYLNIGRINPRKLTLYDYFEPLWMITRPCAVLPALAYSTVFLFGSILITAEMPQLFGRKFNLNTEQVGLQFIGVMVGTLIGEQVGGTASDMWMRRQKNKLSYQPEPEFRLWWSYVGYVLTVSGVAVFLATTEKALAGQWTVAPLVGTAIAAVGNQVATTVLVTYTVDCAAEDAASVGVFLSLVRQMVGFLGPFWFPSMLRGVGLANSSAIVAGLIMALSAVPTMLLHFKGSVWR